MENYWLDKHLAQWQAAMDHNHKPQAVIIGGADGLGKLDLVKLIINDLLCRIETNGHCGQCQNCTLFKHGHHPDIELVVPEKNVIKVKMIRELTDFFTSTPHCSDYKIAIIQEAELMNVAASNALLKVLEEPPSRGILFLVTDSKHQMMPTIRSRCISLDVYLNQDEKSLMSDWLQQKSGQDQLSVNDALLLCDYQPLTALDVLESEQLDQFKKQLDAFHAAITHQESTPQIAKYLTDNSTKSDWLLMQRYCLQLLKNKFDGKQSEVFADHPLNQIIKKSPKVVHIIIKLADLIQQFMLNLNTQIKTQLLLESMLVEIKSEVNLGS